MNEEAIAAQCAIPHKKSTIHPLIGDYGDRLLNVIFTRRNPLSWVALALDTNTDFRFESGIMSFPKVLTTGYA